MGRRVALLALSFALVAPPLPAATPAELRVLLERGKADEAYRVGRSTPEQLGNPPFDFAFGIAAIAAGRASEGVLALERFLLNHPDHDAARVELARGYFALGEDARAREEFETAMAGGPPPPVRAVIEEYLAAIRVRAAKYQPTAMAYLMLGGGYDSNPRAGVDNPEISLPVFGTVTVVDSGVRRGDKVREAGAGVRLTAPFSPTVTAFAAGSADASRHPELDDFDQAHFAGSTGVAGRDGRWGWRAAASFSYQRLGGEPYRRARGLALDASYMPDERSAWTAGVQGGRFLFHGVNAVRDSDFIAATAGWKRFFATAWRPEIELAGNVGRERNRLGQRQDLSRDLLGARVSGSVTPVRGWTLGAGVSWLASDYLEPDLALQTTRSDRYLAGDLSLEWRFSPTLAARAEFVAARNRSNLELYEYRRHAAMLRLRYETR